MNYCMLFWILVAYVAGNLTMLSVGFYLSRKNLRKIGDVAKKIG